MRVADAGDFAVSSRPVAETLRSAPDVARYLGVDPKSLRDWLRSTYPRPDDLNGARWYLTQEMVAAARRHFDTR